MPRINLNSAMSRQILSYADMGPISNVTVPMSNPVNGSAPTQEPPRKRKRTDGPDSEGTTSNSAQAELSLSQGSSNVHPGGNKRPFHASQNSKAKAPSSRARGRSTSQHWDAQAASEVTELMYVEGSVEVDVPTRAPGQITNSGVWGVQKGGKQSQNTPSRVRNGNTSVRRPNVGESIGLGEDEWDDSALIDAWNAAEAEYIVRLLRTTRSDIDKPFALTRS